MHWDPLPHILGPHLLSPPTMHWDPPHVLGSHVLEPHLLGSPLPPLYVLGPHLLSPPMHWAHLTY